MKIFKILLQKIKPFFRVKKRGAAAFKNRPQAKISRWPRLEVIKFYLRRNNRNRTVISSLTPSLHHVHELYERICRGRNLMSHWPAHQLEQLNSFSGSLHSGHEFRQGHDLKNRRKRYFLKGF